MIILSSKEGECKLHISLCFIIMLKKINCRVDLGIVICFRECLTYVQVKLFNLPKCYLHKLFRKSVTQGWGSSEVVKTYYWIV